MRGVIVKDWSKINWDRKEDRKKVLGALQYFLTLPDKFAHFKGQEKEKQLIRKALQEFSTKGDFPTSVLDIIDKYHLTTGYDNGYEEIFDIRDFSGTKKSGFDLLDVQSGLTFEKVDPGGKLKVYSISGSKVHVYFDYYGGALGWHRQLIDDEEWWTLEDNAIEFRNKAYAYRAQVFYALIEALDSSKNVAWQNPEPSGLASTDPSYIANRDAQTINKAAVEILTAIKDKGYSVNPVNAEMIVLTPLALKGRIRRALGLMLQPMANSEKFVDFNFRMITTTLLSSNTQYYVILPKNKLKGGYRMDLKVFSDFDILSYTDTTAGWMRYGGAIGDSDQLRRCLIS